MNSYSFDDAFISHGYRQKKHISRIILFIIMIISSGGVLTMGILLDNSFFYVVCVIFLVVMSLNLMIVSKRSRFYPVSLKINNNRVDIVYFDKDEEIRKSIPIQDFDFHFGILKNEEYLVVWEKNEQLFIAFASFGKLKNYFSEMKEVLKMQFPSERLQVQSFLFRERVYSKGYNFKLFT